MLKKLYKFLKYGVCLAINPCTHEYLCVPTHMLQSRCAIASMCMPANAYKQCDCRFAFNEFDFPPKGVPGVPLGSTGLTVRFSLDNLGLAPVNPEMNSNLPGIDVKSGELQRPAVLPSGMRPCAEAWPAQCICVP